MKNQAFPPAQLGVLVIVAAEFVLAQLSSLFINRVLKKSKSTSKENLLKR